MAGLLFCNIFSPNHAFVIKPLVVNHSTTKNAPRIARIQQFARKEDQYDNIQFTVKKTQIAQGTNRRAATAAIASALMIPVMGSAVSAPPGVSAERPLDPLENIAFGEGQWKSLKDGVPSAAMETVLPEEFSWYLTRILINYDKGMAEWWAKEVDRVSLLSIQEQESHLAEVLVSLSKSLQMGLERMLENKPVKSALVDVFDMLSTTYGSNAEAKRQIAIAFSLLPFHLQPTTRLQDAIPRTTTAEKLNDARENRAMSTRFTSLLPLNYHLRKVDGGFELSPSLGAWKESIGELAGLREAVSAASPLTRDLPRFSALTYALFGISGGTGCAITHAIVIPLDVVKTRAQTSPEDYGNVLGGTIKIAREEGVTGLFLGAQATLMGYLWYGISVYPCYTLFKRCLSQTPVDTAFAAAHMTEIGLLAGALASVVASLGLTPLEAARIRVVADPNSYRSKGLIGTIQLIASENTVKGWKTLYDGLPSLMARQVIFGSVKFLAFERACSFIFDQAPILRETVWTSLCVSLVAGAFSGALSSIVSQPADSVLTYVAQNNAGGRLGVLEGSQVMIQKEGMGSLFRGLGSRCVWASSIIAGQFLLYDVFRTWFGVSATDLTQVYVVLPTLS